MKLKVTLRRPGGDSTDLTVTTDVGATVGDLARQLALSDPKRGRTVSAAPTADGLTLSLIGQGSPRTIDPATPISESGLFSGAVIALAKDSDRFAHVGRAAAATLVIVDGPDRGREFPLHSGTNVIGRERGCEVQLRDEMASRRHARINVSEVVEIVDLGSANGVSVGSSEVARALVAPGDRVTVGDTVFTVRLNAGARIADSPSSESGASVGFIRSPRVESVFEGRTFDIPDLPERPGGQRFPLIALLAPVIMGGVMYVMTQNLMSIAFVALTPLMLVGSFAEQHFAGRSAYKKALSGFWADVDRIMAEGADAKAIESASRHHEHPSLEDCLAAVRDRSPLLWARRPDEPRYGDIRLGLGPATSRIVVKLPEARRAPRDVFSQLTEKVAPLSVISPVPVVAQPLTDGAVGVAGPRSAALGVARSLVVQFVALHSPAELIVASVASTRGAQEWDWLKWLPHTASPHSPLTVAHLASGATAISELLSELEDLVTVRAGKGDKDLTPRPTVLFIVESDAPADFGRLAQLAERGWPSGVIVLWVAPDLAQLPAACKTYVSVGVTPEATVGYVHRGDVVQQVAIETATGEVAMATARRLAPVTDVGAPVEDDSDLPRAVSFLDLTGRTLVQEPQAVIERWKENQSLLTGPFAPKDELGNPRPVTKAGTLRAVVGQSAAGPFTLDLRSDGPHALVGGTTGAGKSELLQAWILGMAANHSPQRLTFLFVDYKGGAAFAECEHLPHTIGLVTDLNTHLVRRALTSLGAELRYRERVLERYKAKDLVTLEKRGALDAPPSLVLVVDEFAALVSEVPEFVDGVVNIAQRGRSLGIHLILATQRPAGVIKDNLRANTNLRLALRMADEDDSRDVLGSSQAAFFDPNMPGRAVSKTGPGRLVPFQTAYAGARTGDTAPPPQIDVAQLDFGVAVQWELDHAATPVAPTVEVDQDIARVVRAVIQAHEAAEIGLPRKPWLSELKHHYNLADRAEVPWVRRDDELVFGVLDVPEDQAQVPVAFYPDKEGNLAVYGTGGTGKSTLLRTLAISAGSTIHGGPCHVYGLDFSARGLEMLKELPHVGSIISGGDVERTTRLIAWLRQLIDDRAQRYSARDAGSIAAYRRITGDSAEPRILLLVDGIAAFRSAYESSDRAKWFDMFMSIASDGRRVGVHVILSTDQRSGIHPTLGSSIQRRIVLRMSHVDEYGMLGVPSEILQDSSPPGRGIYDNKEVQIAVLGSSAEPQAQALNIRKFARSMTAAGIQPAPEIKSLPEALPLDALAPLAGKIVIGMESQSMSSYGFDPEGTFLVVGPPGSGRSTALATIAQAARRWRPDLHTHLLSDRRSSVPEAVSWTTQNVGHDSVGAWSRDIVDQAQRGVLGASLVVIESANEFASSMIDMDLQAALKAILRSGGLVVSEADSGTIVSPMGLWGLLRTSRRGIALQPDQGDGSSFFKTDFPRVSRGDFVPGRGYLADKGRAVLVHMALPRTVGLGG